MHIVYVLKSLKDNKLYVGSTRRDINDRLRDHNAGRVRSTKARRPFELLYKEKFDNYKDARLREHLLKRGSIRKFLRYNCVGAGVVNRTRL